jgi:primase-polymerase (primpol)-like protein
LTSFLWRFLSGAAATAALFWLWGHSKATFCVVLGAGIGWLSVVIERRLMDWLRDEIRQEVKQQLRNRRLPERELMAADEEEESDE